MKRAAAFGTVAAVALATLAEAHAAPAFQPEVYFAGRTRSSGVIRDAFGEVVGHLSGETRGRGLSDGTTTFDQVVRRSDGSVLKRRWHILRTGPSTLEATATDVVGVARGTIEGRTLHLVSTVRLDQGNPLSDVDFDQTMVLQADGRTVFNHSVVSKLGLVLRYVDERFVRSGRSRGRR